jgi:hypothetical protein
MISRRAFLGLGSAALVARVVAGRFQGERSDADAPTTEPFPGELSAGYWLGDGAACKGTRVVAAHSARWVRASKELDDHRPDVIGASRLPSDRRLVSADARVTVHGVCEGDRSWIRPSLESVAVDLLFVSGEGAARVVRPCSAWGLSRGGVHNRSSSVSMRTPVDPSSGLGLSIVRASRAPGWAGRMVQSVVLGRRNEGSRAWRRELWFTEGADGKTPQLGRGTYFVACPERPERGPAWERYQFRSISAGGPRVLTRRGADGLEPADFDYLVVTIDDAQATARTVA